MSPPKWCAAAVVTLPAVLLCIVSSDMSLQRWLSPCARTNAPPAVVDGTIATVLASAANASDLGPRVLSTDPWILIFDRFASDEECDALVERVMHQPSPDFVESQIVHAGGTSVRSSSSLWCDHPNCYDSVIVTTLMRRLSRLANTSTSNAELLQLLRYDVGQEYQLHHDYNCGDAGAAGARAYSFVLFLSTPSAGGELHFADLDLHVTPARGAAVLWPSLMNEDVRLPELLTHHASRPVLAGQKLAAVTWIRQYDYRTPAVERRCSMDRVNGAPPSRPLEVLPHYLAAREAAGLEARVPPALLSKIAMATGSRRQDS